MSYEDEIKKLAVDYVAAVQSLRTKEVALREAATAKDAQEKFVLDRASELGKTVGANIRDRHIQVGDKVVVVKYIEDDELPVHLRVSMHELL
jgi:hypothetical protein